ncbi:molybdopterin-synthase adenylyltransferase MoeB [Wenyingzhuangia aestuarii]|uniref:molybdopterin-synthase adenylyltransferase MoeB n=1 Tax=Wenyingzhuangia aestuarii TaxID=1647582 RepID=UPI00143A9602|nr:molybdopterin-synthase adenylyltransferase MoeB [Wenyingzhuangia aestuarii]NJB81949.1 adenylyltransferase/sulfurtransferase [Wenyingzhuangia aestuarii]
MALNSNEKILYSRHLLLNEIGLEGQEKIKNAKVLVIGAGGLGCPILQYLTAAGVGTIGVMDGDTVDVTNLQRQILFTVDDIGKSKARAATNRMKQLNPYVKFKVIDSFLTINNAVELFNQYDIIVDGSDNFQTRYLCNDAAVLANKPLVFGSIFKFEGQVSVFNYKNGPTYRCLYPTPPKQGSVPSCSEIGVLGVLPGIIGSYQANEVIKIICGIGDVLSGKLLTINTLSNQNFVLGFEKNTSIKITQLIDYDFFCGIEEFENEIEFSEITSAYQLVDIRTQLERDIQNIGGIHIPEETLRNNPNLLNSTKRIVLYCETGNRSKQLIKDLNLTVSSLKGGIKKASQL